MTPKSDFAVGDAGFAGARKGAEQAARIKPPEKSLRRQQDAHRRTIHDDGIDQTRAERRKGLRHAKLRAHDGRSGRTPLRGGAGLPCGCVG